MRNEEFRKLLLAYPSKAIHLLYEEYYQKLIRIAFRYTREEKSAEDVVQETFAYIWENYKRIGEYHNRSIQYYLLKIVRNKAISEYRKVASARKSKLHYLTEHSFDMKDLPAEAAIIRKEISDRVRKLIATFPKRERECLNMKLDHEMTTQQIATALKVSIKAVERSITSGNKRLVKIWSIGKD